MNPKLRIEYLTKKLSNMDDQLVIVEDKNGIDVARIYVDSYGGIDSIDLDYTGHDYGISLWECLSSHPESKFYKVKKGDEI